MDKRKQPYRSRTLASIGIAAILVSPSTYGEHNGGSDTTESAFENASCNASFLSSCAHAAPWPHAGSGIVDIGILVFMLCALLLGHPLRRKKSMK
jgi:hypothetical protein